jgi:anti-sigma factor RsiW
MNCDDYRNRIHEHLRGGVQDAEAAELERHAETCPDCRGYLASCRELSCREFIEFLHGYIDRELPEPRRVVFDRHLSVCPDCRNYLDGYRKTMALGVEALSELSDREIPEDLVRAILEARKKS